MVFEIKFNDSCPIEVGIFLIDVRIFLIEVRIALISGS